MKTTLKPGLLLEHLLIGRSVGLLVAGTLVLAFLSIGFFESAEYNDFRRGVEARAAHAALASASAVSRRLSSRFLDLGFVAATLPEVRVPFRTPGTATERTLRIFLAMHPSLVDFELYNPRTGRILWSTRVSPGSTSAPIYPANGYGTPLPENPSFLVGRSRLSARLGTRILPLSILLPGRAGSPTLGVRTSLRVTDLLPSKDHRIFSYSLRDLRNGDILFMVRGIRPDSPLLPEGKSSARIMVPGYPFEVTAYWPTALVWDGWMAASSHRWMVEEGGLFFLVLTVFGIRTLVRRQERQGRQLAELSALDEAIFDGAGALGLVLGPEGEALRINRTARIFLGVTAEEVQGKPWGWMRSLSPKDRTEVRGFFDALMRGEGPVSCECAWTGVSGERRSFEWSIAVLRDAEGAPLYHVFLGLDVTERRKLEENLEEKNRRLERLLAFDVLRGRVAEAVSGEIREEEILSDFCRLAIDVPEIRLAWVGRPGEDGVFRVLASSGENGYLEHAVVSNSPDRPEGRGPMGQAWREGMPVYNPSFAQTSVMEPWAGLARRFGFQSSASIPVHRGGAIWAVLTVYIDREESFEPELRHLLEAIADNLSLALDRFDLLESERKATALKETLLANTTAGIDLVRYPDRVVVEANRGLLEILGYGALDEVVGHNVRDLYFLGDDSFARMGEASDKALETGSARLRDLRIRRADGSEGFVDLSGQKIAGDDSDTIVWTIVDVSERHRLARDLSRLADFNSLLAQVNQAISEATMEETLFQAICDLAVRFGKFRLAWIGRPGEDNVVAILASAGETAFLENFIISVDPDQPGGEGVIGEVWRTGRPLFNADIFGRPGEKPQDDRAIPFSLRRVTALPVVRETGIWGIMALYHDEPVRFDPALQEVLSELARDVSRGLDRLDSLRRERELAALEKVLLENTRAGIMLLEKRRIRYANDRMRQMMGYDQVGEMVGQSTRILYGDSGEFERVGFSYDLLTGRDSVEVPDVRMVTKQGRPVIVDISLARIPDEPSVVVGTIHDVGDRHAQTERLRLLSSYNTLLAHASEALSSGSGEEKLFSTLCELTVTYGEMTLAAILRPDGQGGFHVTASWGPSDFQEKRQSFIIRGPDTLSDLLHRTFKGRRPVFEPDMTGSRSGWAELLGSFGLSACGVLPLIRKGEPWGLLFVGHVKEGAFLDPVIEGLLTELARNISLGLDRLDLLVRQNLLSSAVGAVGEGVVITETDGRVIFVNDGFSSITGYSADEMIGQNCRILQGERTDPATVEKIRTALREGRPFHGQILNYRKDRIPFWNLLSISPLRDPSGKVVEFVGNQRDITPLIELTQKLEFDSRHDRLTGLPNRRGLDLEFDRLLARSARYGWSFAVAILDLDGFKAVNDRYGHEAGDRLLRLTGERILGVLRKTDFLARLGGDEFVLLLENISGREELWDLLGRIDRTARTPVNLENGIEVSVGVSIGVALSSPGSGPPENPEKLMRLADQALYESKAHKTNRSRSWVVHGETVPLERTLAQRLLYDRKVEVHYQPVLDSRSGRIAGIEALARLRDPDGNILSPASFLQDYGGDDLFELSRQVLERALSDLGELFETDPSLWISVNVDPRSVTEGCLECLGRMLGEARIDPSRLTLEILEGQEFGETVVALELLKRLKGLGIRLAMDDVGSAYSSLLRLKDLPVDKVKLDQGFVRTLETRPRDLHFVEAIMELSHRMGLSLVVEGVETGPILEAMRMLGVDYLQGYAISRPLPLASLVEFLQKYPSGKAFSPKSLLGLYALLVRTHGMQLEVLLQSPTFFNLATPEEVEACPVQKMIQSLGLISGGKIDRLHARYHKILAAEIKRVRREGLTLQESDLAHVKKVSDSLAEAILEEERRRSGEGMKK